MVDTSDPLSMESSIKPRVMQFIFNFLATLFVLSVIKTAIYVPVIFSESSAIKYKNRYSLSTENAQVELILSPLGFLNPYLGVIFIYILFGVILNIIPGDNLENLKKTWLSLLVNMLAVVFGIMVTMFSVWGS